MLSNTHLQCADGSPFQEGNEPTHKKKLEIYTLQPQTAVKLKDESQISVFVYMQIFLKQKTNKNDFK